MKLKYLIFIFSALTSGFVMAQMSFNSSLDELLQMGSQSFGDATIIDDTSSEISDIPVTADDEPFDLRLSPGDTLILRFSLIEDFINSGDLNNFLSGVGANISVPSYVGYGDQVDSTSFGPLRGIRTEQLQDSLNITAERRAYLRELVSELNSFNPFLLNALGELNLPGIAPISLSGLTPSEAALRIRSEPDLFGLIVSVTQIPVSASTRDNLKLFGQELFDDDTDQLTLSRSMPGNYSVGTGDQILVQLYGSTNYSNVYTVSDTGAINLPEVGPIYVIGVENTNLTDHIQREISNLIVATNVSASIVSARPIEVFVAGEVNNPGAKIVRPFSTLLDVISAAEGIKQTASIRKIKIIRGTNVLDVDLYGFLIGGDTESNTRILSGDTILINPAESIIGISGEVRRQYYFELIEEEGFESLIQFAGGFTGNANQEEIFVERYGATIAYTSIPSIGIEV